MIDRLPPQNLDSEQAVLGSILIDPTSLVVSEQEIMRRMPDGSLDPSKSPAVVMEFLRPEDFYRQAHGRIYAAMLALYERGVRPDVVTVAEELERTGDLEGVGGAGYLSTLGNDTPSSLSCVQYAQIVHRKAVLRNLIGVAGKIAAIGYEDGSDVGEALDRAYGEFREVAASASRGQRTKFSKAGFRAYGLSAADESWRLVLSRVDVNEREPRGLITVYAKGNPEGEEMMCRTVGLFGGTNLNALAKELSNRLSEPQAVWAKRLDALARRTIREAQAATETASVTARPDRPNGRPWLFRGRMRFGRTLSLFGPGSAGKTTIGDGLLLSASTGQEIIPGWVPTRRFVTGVLDWDEGREEMDVRLYAMCNAYGIDSLNHHYRRMSRPLADCADDVGKWIIEHGIELLTVSPVKRAVRQAQGDGSGPVNELYEVLREFGTTNLLIDHVTGANMDADHQATREFGSSSKRDNARGSYSVYPQGDPEPGRRVVVIRNTKPDALTPAMAPQAICIEFEPQFPDEAGTYDIIRFSASEVEVPQPTTRSNGHPVKETQMAKFLRLVRENAPVPTTQLVVISSFSAANIRQMAARARKAGVPVECGEKGWVINAEPDPDLGMGAAE
jgi:hypothetical protein